MSRVWTLADALVAEAYEATALFPTEERYGLTSQIRRAAVSVPTNLVEGSYRRTNADFSRFIEIALGSAAEVRYLVQLARRILPSNAATDAKLEIVAGRYDELVRGLSALLSSRAEGLKG